MKCPKCGGKHLVGTDYHNWYMIAFFMLINIIWNPHIFLISTAAFLFMIRGKITKKQMLCLDCGRVAEPQLNTSQEGISKIDKL